MPNRDRWCRSGERPQNDNGLNGLVVRARAQSALGSPLGAATRNESRDIDLGIQICVTDEEVSTMSNVYSYRTDVLRSGSSQDLSGFDVEATDGSIGKIDEASYETSASYMVVDTGFWIFGKKRLIPAGVVERIDPEDHKVFVRMTKDEVKSAPDYDPDRHRQEQNRYRDEVGGYYSTWS